MAVKPIPKGYHTLTPHLVVREAAKAIAFYKKAFGATEVMKMKGPDGKSIMHAEIMIGDSHLMLAEENKEQFALSPQSLSGTPVSVMIYDKDVDALFKKAVKAGATPLMEPADMFWGDRFGVVQDPFGHKWELATHKEDLDPAEMKKRMKAFFKQMTEQQH
ncbi:MAG: VOC family protein [Planctomycetes bacterium]|nr:VOC family protein [Planctomycetota bacterium]